MLASLLQSVTDTHSESKAVDEGPPRKRQKCTAHIDMAAAGGLYRFAIYPLVNFQHAPVRYAKPKVRHRPPPRPRLRIRSPQP